MADRKVSVTLNARVERYGRGDDGRQVGDDWLLGPIGCQSDPAR